LLAPKNQPKTKESQVDEVEIQVSNEENDPQLESKRPKIENASE
jgi:hypothetical protein